MSAVTTSILIVEALLLVALAVVYFAWYDDDVTRDVLTRRGEFTPGTRQFA